MEEVMRSEDLFIAGFQLQSLAITATYYYFLHYEP